MRYNRDLVGGGDVIAEGKIGLRQAVSLEEVAIRIPSDQIVEPAAHLFGEICTCVVTNEVNTIRPLIPSSTRRLASVMVWAIVS